MPHTPVNASVPAIYYGEQYAIERIVDARKVERDIFRRRVGGMIVEPTDGTLFQLLTPNAAWQHPERPFSLRECLTFRSVPAWDPSDPGGNPIRGFVRANRTEWEDHISSGAIPLGHFLGAIVVPILPAKAGGTPDLLTTPSIPQKTRNAGVDPAWRARVGCAIIVALLLFYLLNLLPKS